MAGTGLIALLDDIASVLDDVAVLTKVAGRKTAGVLGDDLALNAQQVSGVRAERELPVVWAVAKGSALNKAILVPAALAISAIAPWAIVPLLMVGGAFLCFEGAEKIVHRYFHRAEDDVHREELREALADPAVDLVALEKQKIKGAIRTDFILSAEIIIITLGTVAVATFPTRVLVLATVAVLMTVGVYGLVAGIVKLDDAGLALRARGQAGQGAWARFQQGTGDAILVFAPRFMKFLSVAGTIAMFLVGGGILTHGIGALHHLIEAATTRVGAAVGPAIAWVVPLAADLVVGVVAGLAIVAVVEAFKRLRGRGAPA
jgi:uncharacterized protein